MGADEGQGVRSYCGYDTTRGGPLQPGGGADLCVWQRAPEYHLLGAARSADQEHKSTQGSGATFLGDMQKRAYASANSMQDRLRENQHYSQRGGDLQGTGFTKPG